MRSRTRWRTSERAISSGSEPASARSRTRVISGADRTSSTASSSGPRQTRAAARAGKKAARPAASASPERGSSSLLAIERAHEPTTRRHPASRSALLRSSVDDPADGKRDHGQEEKHPEESPAGPRVAEEEETAGVPRIRTRSPRRWTAARTFLRGSCRSLRSRFQPLLSRRAGCTPSITKCPAVPATSHHPDRMIVGCRPRRAWRRTSRPPP